VAYKQGAPTATTSPDLGLTVVAVRLDAAGAHFPDGTLVAWPDLARIAAAPQKCFHTAEGPPQEIARFSATTGWMRSLYPTAGAPTMLVAGFPMHRIKEIDPHADTQRKLATIAPFVGEVLDTATGLGYTAIGAARTAAHVVTIELDPAALEIARYNPWSQALFGNAKIEQRIGDAAEIVPTFANERFARILHDPPTFSLGGQLYSGAFYRDLYRVLARRGRLFHYIGDLASKGGGTVARGVIRRLHEAGFTRVVPQRAAFGVVAYK
jgi:predicted methyltransferase